VPSYYFAVHAPDDRYDDPEGADFPDHDAARKYGQRIVSELKEGGYDPPGTILYVLDETRQAIQLIPF